MINYESKFSFRKNQKQSIDVSGNPIPNENKGKLVQNLKQKNRKLQIKFKKSKQTKETFIQMSYLRIS
ncbi:hypothetical protein APS47_12525 [Leptospira kirschneri serovar Mozdok]|nr:hypothetical protein LEP1GSC044_0089 [Leptospira kirschneri serovar Grippotyphosa str. RM52]EKP04697.1 hypothetical protein LEP1GSC018_1327 [Leptospira kirschneri str. 2008720114]EKR07935.1 hypothetical protein LEP1GSC122_2327 [Leptospira kirschneri serovar Valbuzzi str. 200702274]EMK05041.1 hypothetical protein LEP1GSC176_1971 [Leptospira kirschneri str. MMD1493]KPZ77415.1 hypothetical protein APS47_12525 [Leptospira kirschneri serovar Mozdok]